MPTAVRRLGQLLPLLLLVACAGGEPADPATRDDADKAARAWLALTDGGRYAESWDAADPSFQAAIGRDDWAGKAKPVREPLGALIERDLDSATLTTDMPGAPDGKYVIIKYETSFANKKHAVETVTPHQGPDGTWKVSGYYIK